MFKDSDALVLLVLAFGTLAVVVALTVSGVGTTAPPEAPVAAPEPQPPGPPSHEVVDQVRIRLQEVDDAISRKDYEKAETAFAAARDGLAPFGESPIDADVHVRELTLTAADDLAKAKRSIGFKNYVGADGVLADAVRVLTGVPEDYAPGSPIRGEVSKVRASIASKAEHQRVAAACEAGKNSRDEYADLWETNALSQGQDASARTSGTCGTTLTITWILCSRPVVYQMQQLGEAGALGFTKVKCNDGYGGGAYGDL